MAYTLFCFEFNQKYGIFRYFNQPYIETQPIKTTDGDVIGFQAKYYDESTQLADKESDLKKAIRDAKTKYGDISRFIIYTNKELSASSIKTKVKPQYQINIEKCGSDNGIKVEWRVTSNFEIMLLDPQLYAVRELYFNANTDLQLFAERIQKRTASIISSIKSDIIYIDRIIKIEYPQKEIFDFTKSDNSVFVVYGNAGTGKSGYVKDFCEQIYEKQDSCLLVFSASDFDVKEETALFNQFGNYGLDGLLSLYDSEDNKYCVIESAEKYSNFINFDVFRTAIHSFIESGWKIIFSIRKQYKNGFINAILDGVSIGEFCIDSIDETNLKSISANNDFELPSNNNLCSLLCNLFYLKLYLELLTSGTSIPSDTKSFTDQIWKQVIRNDRQRQGNLPVRREAFIEGMALSLLKNESYVYRTQSSDDSEVISLLEEQGIITPYNDTYGFWVFNHDVYEEIAINHIFDCKYDESLEIKQVIEVINDSLRSRKMYRIWLESKLREPDSNLLSTLTEALVNTELSQSWKDETIIALMNSENDEAFHIMESLFSANSFALFTRSIFLLNTACKCIIRNNEYMKLVQTQKISTYRFTEPTGKAWHTIFSYISKHINLIPWNTQNLSVVIEAMESWVRNNPTGETTSIIGHIALCFKDKIWQESERKYGLYVDSIYKAINNVILLAAMEIKDELSNMVDNIISNKAFSHRDENYVFLKKALSNIFECGKIYAAIPTKLLQLSWEYWLYKDEKDHFSSLGTESSFGLNHHLHHEYYPTSAYQTPLFALLQTEPKQSIDFIIKLINHVASNYNQSRLNENDSECTEIQIILNDKLHVSQICSDRLWKMYRGTSVAPNLLESILMALEEYLLLYVKTFAKENAVALCFYLLKNSNNIAITAVVLSAAISSPEKLFDVSCVLLNTKELFHLDKARFLSEHGANSFRGFNPRYKRFDDERIKSNQKEFRKKKFEDIILSYQINSEKLPESDYKERLEKLYTAIDNATTEIDKWHPIYQAYYYGIDWRKYKQAGAPIIEEKQISIPMKVDMPQQVVEYAKESDNVYAKALGNTELLLWASFRYKNDEKYKDYYKYEDNPIIAYETVKSLLESDDEELSFQSIETIVFTMSVLLRDFNSALDGKQYDFCKETVLELGFELIKNSTSLFFYHDVKNAIITEIANQTLASNNSVDWDNPVIILLAFMLDYRKQMDNNIIKPLSVLWEKKRELGNKLIYAFSKLIPFYDGEDVVTFVESQKEEILSLLSAEDYSLESIDVSVLDYNTGLYINNMLNNHDANISTFVIRLGNLLWKKLFKNELDDETHKIFELEYEYKLWLAEYLLNLPNNEQCTLIQELMPFVRFDREFKDLLSDIVGAEDKNPRCDAFWNLWLMMQDHIFQVYEKRADDYRKTDSPVYIGYGFEDVLVTYLLADFWETPGVEEWHTLKPQTRTFYMTTVNRLGYNPTILFSIARVLNTIGKKLFEEEGIIWLSEIINNNSHLSEKPLPDNTLYYIEEYIFSYVKGHTDSLQTNIALKRKVITILDFLVERGSTMGFLLREEII